MFTGTDKIQILSLDLIHHSIHFGKAHNACYHIAPDHKRRNTIGKPTSDHKITGIGKNRRMKPCDIAHQIIESVSGYSSGTFKINAVKALHDICMIRNIKFRNHRISVFLDFYVFAVIFSDRNRRINDVWDRHHDLFNSCFYFFFFCR